MFSRNDNIHINYNEVIKKLDTDFNTYNKLKILVIGNSYGRDVANIFLESSIASEIDLKYFDINRAKKDPKIVLRWNKADLIVFAANGFLSKEWISEIGAIFNFNVNFDNIVCFGIKDFGYSNGIHYNKISSILDLTQYYSEMRVGTLEAENKLQQEWGSSYVSLIMPVINKSGQIRIFTNEGKFISQDTVHLTKAGAIFYAEILENILKKIINI